MAMGSTVDDGTPDTWGAELTDDHAGSEHKTLVTFLGAGHFLVADPCEQLPWVETSVHRDAICTDAVWGTERPLDVVSHSTTAFLRDTLDADPAARPALSGDQPDLADVEYVTTAAALTGPHHGRSRLCDTRGRRCPVSELSPCATAIRTYKERVNHEGAAAWVDVPVADGIRMHVPVAGIDATGSEEIRTQVFGLMEQAGLRQALVKIEEFGPYVTCFLRVTAQNGTTFDAVEVFRLDDGRVAEIWAL